MTATCTAIPGCDEKVWSHGWCQRHYQRWRRTGSFERTSRTATEVEDAAELHTGTGTQLAMKLGYRDTGGLYLILRRIGREDLVQKLIAGVPAPESDLTPEPEPTPTLSNILTHAACKGTPTEMFFDPETEVEAIKVCNTCTVRDMCLDWALTYSATRDIDGVFGGLTPSQRRAKRRTRP